MLNKSFFYINVVFCALFTTLLSHTLETLTPPLIFKLPIQSKKPIKQSHSVSLEKILTRGQTFCCLKKEKEMFGLDNIASIIVTPQELTPTCISFKYACEDLKEYENVLINCSTNWVIRTHLINEYQNEFNKVVISNSSRFKCFDKQLSA
jgi:hypothetical protein